MRPLVISLAATLAALTVAGCSGAPAKPAGAPAPTDPPAPPDPPAQSGSGGDGDACLAGTDCASGVCEGEGCDNQDPGHCAPAARGCTRDLRAYCGCDGVTFRTSGSCPSRRYAHPGECQ